MCTCICMFWSSGSLKVVSLKVTFVVGYVAGWERSSRQNLWHCQVILLYFLCLFLFLLKKNNNNKKMGFLLPCQNDVMKAVVSCWLVLLNLMCWIKKVATHSRTKIQQACIRALLFNFSQQWCDCVRCDPLDYSGAPGLCGVSAGLSL